MHDCSFIKFSTCFVWLYLVVRTPKSKNSLTCTNNTLPDQTLSTSLANRLILSVDRLADKVAINSSQSLRLVTQSTALEVWDLSRMSDNLVIGLEQRVDGGVRSRVVRSEQLFSLFENDALDFNKTDVAVVLPAEFLRNVTEGKRAGVCHLTTRQP